MKKHRLIPGPKANPAMLGYAVLAGFGTAPASRAMDFHTPTTQELQNVLTLAANQVALTLNVVGAGWLTSDAAGNRFTNGTMVLLTATPGAGQAFLGSGGDANGTTTPYPLVMDASKSVSANFTRRSGLTPPRSNTARDGQLLFVSGIPDEVYRLEATEDFNGWTDLATITNLSGVVPYTDRGATNLNARFYRARTEP